MWKKVKVVLLENVAWIGNKGTLAEVSAPYAKNVLIKKNIAKLAENDDINKINQQKQQEENTRKKQKERFDNFLEDVRSNWLVIQKSVSPWGKLYDKIGVNDILNIVLKTYWVKLTAKCIEMPKKIEQVGDYDVFVTFEWKKYNLKLSIKSK